MFVQLAVVVCIALESEECLWCLREKGNSLQQWCKSRLTTRNTHTHTLAHVCTLAQTHSHTHLHISSTISYSHFWRLVSFKATTIHSRFHTPNVKTTGVQILLFSTYNSQMQQFSLLETIEMHVVCKLVCVCTCAGVRRRGMWPVNCACTFVSRWSFVVQVLYFAHEIMLVLYRCKHSIYMCVPCTTICTSMCVCRMPFG